MTAPESQFLAGRTPAAADLEGDYLGQILAGLWQRLAGFWVGKRFVGGRSGCNLIRLAGRTLAAVTFQIHTLPSPIDGESRCTLVYGSGQVRDELVCIGEGQLLGRGYVGHGRVQIYFSLQRRALS